MSASEILSAVVRSQHDLQGERDALVPWWSITKSVLAAAVLRLVEQNRVGLDDRFEDWPFTVRQLLQHTSGLTTYGGPDYHDAVASGGPAWPVDDLLARYNARSLTFAPGEGWAYSNIGYLFVRHVVERVTRTDLHQALNDLVLSPAGISATRIATTPGDLDNTHWGNPGNYDPNWVYHGLMIGPPSDAVLFLTKLLAGEIISHDHVLMMQDAYALGGPIPNRPWLQTGYGLGLMIGTMTGCGRAVGHSGAGPGTVSSLYAFLDLPGTPIAAAFAQGSDEGATEREVTRLALLR